MNTFDLEGLVLSEKDTDGGYKEFAAVMQDDASDDEAQFLFDGELGVDDNGVTIEEAQEEHSFDDIDDGEVEEESIEDAADSYHKDTIEAQMEGFQTFADNFEQLPEDMLFTVGDQSLTKQDIVALTQMNESIKDTSNVFAEQSKRNDALNLSMESSFFAAQTETMRESKALQARLNDPYTPDIEKGAIYQQLQQVGQRQQVLQEEVKRYANNKVQRDELALQSRIDNVSLQLQKKHTGESVASVVKYAQEQGIPLEEMRRNASVPYFESMMKAQKYDEMIKNSKGKARTKAKEAVSVKPRARKSAPQQKKPVSFDNVSQRDIGDMFNMLED